MDVFTMVAVIVTVCVLGGILEKHLKSKRNAEPAKMNDDVQAELDALRGRVEVLESIVTDQKYQLNQELRALERDAG